MRGCGAGHFLARFRVDNSPERIRRTASGLAWLVANGDRNVCRTGPNSVRTLIVAKGRIHTGHEVVFRAGTACRRTGASSARGRSDVDCSASGIRARTDSGSGRDARACEPAKTAPESEAACHEAGRRTSTLARGSASQSDCRCSHGRPCTSNGGARSTRGVESGRGYCRASRSAVRRQALC